MTTPLTRYEVVEAIVYLIGHGTPQTTCREYGDKVCIHDAALRQRVQELERSVELDQAAYAIHGTLQQHVKDLEHAANEREIFYMNVLNEEEEARCAQRDQLAAVTKQLQAVEGALKEALEHFVHPAHPGRPVMKGSMYTERLAELYKILHHGEVGHE